MKASKKTQGKLDESTERSLEILSNLDADDGVVKHDSVSEHSDYPGFSGDSDYRFMSPGASSSQAAVYQQPSPYDCGYSPPPPPMWQQGLMYKVSSSEGFEAIC